jgi:alpha-galactosidase
MERRTLVIIGAGSAMFTQGLMADLILTGQPWKLGLVDIDEQALATADGLCRRMVQARDADIAIESSTDRRDVLPGADVVVTTIGVGGRRAWETDVFVPRRYGIYQPVGDTVMPGGISRALRMVPALVDIARDTQALCPRALFVNYANPMTVNCWAVRQATGADVVGLCHGVMHVERDLARFAGAPPGDVTSLAVGLNHFTWIFDLRRSGQDLWPAVKEGLARERNAAPPLPGAKGMKAADSPFTWSLFDTYGAYPAVHDRHVTEFFPERFPQGRYYGKVLGVDAFSFEEVIALGDRIYAEMTAQALGQQPLNEALFARAAGEHEQLLDILAAMAGDTRRVFSANLPNRGAVPNLPFDAVLELPAVATATGLRAMQVLDFPERLAEVLRRKIESQHLTVEAALSGKRALFVDALLADGAVTERGAAERLADDLLREQRQHLPQFA